MADVCASEYVFRLLGRKWVHPLLRLLVKPRQFSELEKRLPGITHHILSGELKYLVGEGIVVHKDIFYALSDAGSALLTASGALTTWADEYTEHAVCIDIEPCTRCSNDFSQ